MIIEDLNKVLNLGGAYIIIWQTVLTTSTGKVTILSRCLDSEDGAQMADWGGENNYKKKYDQNKQTNKIYIYIYIYI